MSPADSTNSTVTIDLDTPATPTHLAVSEANLALAQLYSKVRVFIGFKACDTNGKAVHRGTLHKTALDFISAAANRETRRASTLSYLQKAFGDVFTATTNRNLQLSDLRTSFSPEDGLLNAVFLDDAESTIGAHVLLETSPGSWHAHFRTTRPCDEDEAAAVLRMLRDWHDSDPRAATPRHCRRFHEPHMNFEIDWNAEDLDVDFAVSHYPVEANDEATALLLGDRITLTVSQKAMYSEIWTRLMRNANGRASNADFGLAMHVLEHDGSLELAREAILSARPNIIEDKGSYLPKYLEKALTKATEKFKPTRKDLSSMF